MKVNKYCRPAAPPFAIALVKNSGLPLLSGLGTFFLRTEIQNLNK